MSDENHETAHQAALRYRAQPKPGKLEILAAKPLTNQLDLARTHLPGVAVACMEIRDDPANAVLYTARANLAQWWPTARRL